MVRKIKSKKKQKNNNNNDINRKNIIKTNFPLDINKEEEIMQNLKSII